MILVTRHDGVCTPRRKSFRGEYHNFSGGDYGLLFRVLLISVAAATMLTIYA